MIRTPAKPRPPSGPRAARPPTGTPQLRPAADPAVVIPPPYDPQPPQWSGSDLEWICWQWLVKRGNKIFGRQNVKGVTFSQISADVVYQGAIPTPGLNVDKPFFRSDFILLPGKHPPMAGPGFPNGTVWDPLNDWTHRKSSLDQLRRGFLARGGFLLIWIDGERLKRDPDTVLSAAYFGSSNSAIDRGE